MGLLAAEGLEPIVRDDVLCPKVLELGAIGSCFLGQGHEVLGPLEVTVMVRGDIGDEVGGLVWADEAVTEAECRHLVIVGGLGPAPAYDGAMPLGILQARMTSSRLPGKVLEPIEGMPMIGRQIERLRRSDLLDGLVVATSVDPSDDRLVAYVESLGIPVVRGSLDDVLGRFIGVLDEFSPEVVVRLTADCPLVSSSVVDRVISAFGPDVDYVSNTLEPTWPDGVDVEVVRASALRWVAEHSDDPHEHEHVTLGVYRRPDRFRCANVAGDVDLSSLRWTVDNAEDLAFVRSIYAKLLPVNDHFDVHDVLELLESQPSLSRKSADSARNAALDGLDTGVMKHK